MTNQDYNEIRNPRYFKFLDYKELFSNWDWEWFTTLTFLDSYNYCDSYRLSKPVSKWARDLAKQEDIRVGYLNLIGWKYGHPTMHLLMVGYRSDGSRSLKNVNCKYWEDKWPYKAQIEIPRSNSDVEGYVARHAFWKHAHKEALMVGDKNLLIKLRKTTLTTY